jgi:hypothetical protein
MDKKQKQPPEWLQRLIDVCFDSMALTATGHVGWRYKSPTKRKKVHKLCLYPMPVEIAYGKEDGSVMLPGFVFRCCDLLKKLKAPCMMFTSLPDNEILAIIGYFEGKLVDIEIMTKPFPDEQPSGVRDAKGFHARIPE